MKRHFGFPLKSNVRAHPWNRPLAVRRLPIDEERYGFGLVRAFLLALLLSIAGAGLGLVAFLVPIFMGSAH